MAIFKNKYTFGSVFNFKGTQFKVNGWEIETQDSELIEFLSQNSNWILVGDQSKSENKSIETKVNFSKLSITQLKELLIEKQITIPEDADKKQLLKLLES